MSGKCSPEADSKWLELDLAVLRDKKKVSRRCDSDEDSGVFCWEEPVRRRRDTWP